MMARWTRPSTVAALALALAFVAAAPAGAAPRTPASVRAPHAAGALGAPSPVRPAATTSVPDGAGGAYIAWQDTRDGSSDVYALRVTSTGAPASGWPAAGVAVCTAPGEQTLPALLSDPSGGVFVAWRDQRAARLTADYYAQRLDANGAVQWAANGVRFSTNAATGPVAAPDGSGGVVFAWVGAGVIDADVFVGRLDATGAIPAGWSTNGVVVCSAAGDQRNATVVGASGGAIVTWVDPRASTFLTHVYAQRVNAAGAAQWTANGVQVDAGTGGLFGDAACSDGAGGVIAVWSDFNGVYAQRLNAAGALQWGASGVTVVTTSGVFANQVRAVADGSSGAFVEWVATGASGALVAQHIDATGAQLWPAAGTTLASGGSGLTPFLGDLVPDGAGGAFFAWDDPRSGTSFDVYVQKVNAAGAVQWTANGIAVCADASEQYGASVVLDGAGGVFVTWNDTRQATLDVYGQRLNASGVAQLGTNGAALHADPGAQLAATTVSDGAGGAWVVWQEKSGGQFDVRARHVSSAGTSDGATVNVCTATGHQWAGNAVSDGAGGFVVAWEDRRSGTGDIYAQRVTSAGAVAWTANGVALCTASRDQYDVRIVPDGSGGCIAAWVDNRTSGQAEVYARRVNGAGAAQWTANGVALYVAGELQADPVIAPDGSGGCVVAWYDTRSGSTNEIYAQRLDASGAALWTAGGLSIGEDIDLSLIYDAVSDGAGGALVLFATSTSDPVTGEPTSDALALQWVTAAGAPQWGVSGLVFCDTGALAEAPSLVSDGAGGAIIVWADGRNGPFDVYAQRVTSAGTASWTANGVPVCGSAGWQDMGQAIADGSGGVVVAWGDARGGGAPDAYAQRLNASGVAQFAADGVVVSDVTGGQYGPVLATDGAGGALIAWTDDRSPPTRQVFSAHLAGGGAVSPADGTVGVTAALVSASAEPGRVRVVWQVADAVRATVERRDEASDWRAVATVAVDGDGRVAYVDDAVAPGARLGYRLTLADGGATLTTPAVWVDVPRVSAFALGAVRPNPVTRDATVSFSLASAGPARLELFDLAGRRVAVRALAGLAPGAHVVPLGAEGLQAGLYVVRLTQDGHSASARVVIAR